MTDEIIYSYRSKSFDELRSIKPKWAYGKHLKKLSEHYFQLVDKRFKVFVLNTSDLIRNADFKEVNLYPLFTGETKNDLRIAGVLYRWQHGDVVDPPWIGLDQKNKLAFNDGRHRAKLTFHLGYKKMPVLIDRDDEERIRKIVKLTFIYHTSLLNIVQEIVKTSNR